MFCIHHTCEHSTAHHVFHDTACDNLYLIEKIGIIAFHLLTLCIPLLAYHLVLCCMSSQKLSTIDSSLEELAINSVISNQEITPEEKPLPPSPQLTNSPTPISNNSLTQNPAKTELDNSLEIKPYPEIGKQAIAFAQEALDRHSVTPTIWSGRAGKPLAISQPVNKNIASLHALYWAVFFPALEEAIKKHAANNPWKQEEVLKAADACMKIAYAISCWTLEDLPAFTERLLENGETQSYVRTLTLQNSYMFRTFFVFPKTYHWVRAGVVYRKSRNPGSDEAGLYNPDSISSEHATLFYQDDALPHSRWRALFNDYGKRVRMYAPEDELRSADMRFHRWTKKDKKAKKFKAVPDTLPS